MMNHALIKQRQIRAKIARINRNRKLSYKMRLCAIIASDNRPGTVWA